MAQSLTTTMMILIDAAWRRRWLIAMVSSVVFSIGLLYAAFGPRTYVAKSLMLLQESASDLPRDMSAGVRMADRVAGLQALLKSDLVLYSAMLDINGDRAPTKSKEIETWIRDFSAALSLELVGADFLEFRLKGASPKGLGKQLEAVISRLLEALLSTSDTLNAIEMLLERRREELAGAERANVEFQAQLPQTFHEDMERIASMRQRLRERTQELSMANLQLEALRSGGSGSGPTSDIEQISVRIAALQSEVQELQGAIEKSQQDYGVHAALSQRRDALLVAVAKAREEYASYENRFSKRRDGLRVQGLLRAPDRIKLIDAPRDPVNPTNSAFKIAVASLLLSLGLAALAATLAELFDQRVRRPEEIEALTGVPVIARLPRARAAR